MLYRFHDKLTKKCFLLLVPAHKAHRPGALHGLYGHLIFNFIQKKWEKLRFEGFNLHKYVSAISKFAILIFSSNLFPSHLISIFLV